VVDLETTGLSAKDQVVEIGVAKVNLERGEVRKFYHSVIGHDDIDHNSWIFHNSDLKYEEVKEATNANRYTKVVADEVHDRIMADAPILPAKVTSFNVSFDFGNYLLYEPWHFDSEDYDITECVMLAATPVCQLHSPYGYGYKWPRLHEARRKILDPLDIRKYDIKDEKHRALDDAYLAGHILLEMNRIGVYNIV
jgi:DNA polymerase III epsilon subunit-like protein